MDKIKKCQYCGKTYNAIRLGQITCGADECRKLRNREVRTAYEKNVKKKRTEKNDISENQKLIAEENEIALSIGLDYGLYKAYLYIGYLDQYLKIRFHNESNRNADERTVERSWIGGCNKSTNSHDKITDYSMQRLTDYERMR